jgi:hypothetical protein
LDIAFEKIHSIAEFINEAKRKVESMSKVLEIQNKILGDLDKPLLTAHRCVLKEATVEEVREKSLLKTASLRKRVLILFNDMFLIVSEVYHFKGIMYLGNLICEAKEYRDRPSVVFKTPNFVREFVFSSAKERDEILVMFQNSKKKYMKARASMKAKKSERIQLVKESAREIEAPESNASDDSGERDSSC